MEKRIYTVKVDFMLEVEADNSNKALTEANRFVQFGTYQTEARFLNLRINSVKKPIPQATQVPPEEIAAKCIGSELPAAEVIQDSRLKDDCPF